MSNLPTPEEIRAKDREKDLLKNQNFAQLLNTLPLKQQKLVLLMLTAPNMTLTERAKAAGYSIGKNSKVQAIYKAVEGKLGPALLELGITQGDVLKVLRDSLVAMKSTPFKDGDKIAFADIPDHPLRLKAAELLLKLGNYFPQTSFKGTIEHKHSIKPLHEQISSRTTAELLELKKQHEEGKMIAAEFEVVND